jgi:hypothetical protein
MLRLCARPADAAIMISRIAAALLPAALLGCGAAAPTPEQQARAVLGALEAAAEAGDASAFAEVVSADYQAPAATTARSYAPSSPST